MPWTRRAWLMTNAAVLTTVAAPALRAQGARDHEGGRDGSIDAGATSYAMLADSASMQSLAQRAVEAAQRAGATYADARLTRTVIHKYSFNSLGALTGDSEEQGVGVRAMVDGRWGFAASPVWTADEAARLGRDAATIARETGRGVRRTVDLSQYPVAKGTWTTPVTIDPFTVPVEEKADVIQYWIRLAIQHGISIDVISSYLLFARQERAVATSDGSAFHQIVYESGGEVFLDYFTSETGRILLPLTGLEMSAQGWEHILSAGVPEQLKAGRARMDAEIAAIRTTRPNQIGSYTIVCDGYSMAAMLGETLGVATQLDRALGYEANAGGTSFITDPLGMIGVLPIAAPMVTVTGNRNVPTQLATTKWDDEGVEPTPFTLVKEGVLNDFQTTREQAAWLTSAYQRMGISARSHGCAASEDALKITLQHMPNLTLEAPPQASSIRVDDLIANVPNGIFLEGGVARTDFQMRTGLLFGKMTRIKQGRLGPRLGGGAVAFDTDHFWKNIVALGGTSTAMTMSSSQYLTAFGFGRWVGKGQPAQMTGHSVNAVAATITGQPIIDPSKRA